MATVTSEAFTAVPLFMQAASGDPAINYSAADFGRLVQATWQSVGVLTATSFKVEQADVVGWSVKIRPGYAVLGSYLVYQPTAITVSVSAFNTAPSATRTHRVYLVVNDKLAGGSEYAAHIVVVEDTGAGATAPTAAGVLLLAAFTISPGQSNIQQGQISAKPRNASDAGDFLTLADNGYLAGGVLDATAAIGTAPARARFGSGRIQLSGALRRTGTTTFAAGPVIVATLPSFMRPLYTVYCAAACSDTAGDGTGSLYYRMQVDTAGVMTANIPTGSSPQYLMLDGIVFEAD